jgi:gamma-glutamyltranspeptidase/glutathione hydrolase
MSVQSTNSPYPGRALRCVLAAIGLGAIVAVAEDADGPIRTETQMVVAANPHAAEAGVRMLRAGGSAVDAAIAVQLVLSLVEPQSSGIGGGAFMLYFDGAENQDGGTIVAYEGRETAPAAAAPDMFLDSDGKPRPFPVVGFGGLSVGVPGVMRMLEAAHADYGRLPWAQLFTPAIELAERGFEITPRLYFLLDRFTGLARAEAFKRHFYDENGRARPTGYRLANPEYAATLRTLASDGADAMYSGPLAEAIVDTVTNNSLIAGPMTLEDMRDYRAHKTDALCTPYREWRVCGPQLPSSGGVTVQQILGILAPFDLAAIDADSPQSIHLVAEASRLAFADRNFYLGDPEFVDAPVSALLERAYLDRRASLIDRSAAMRAVAPGTPANVVAWNYAPSKFSDLASTSHFSIADQWGDAVSMTTSVQGAFGSQLMVGGFILNNQLTDFSFEPEEDGLPVANRAESGKRPLSSMTPTFVVDNAGRLRMIVGSPGGTRIINFVAQTLIGVLDWGLNIQQAVAAPHFVAQGGFVELEEGTPILEHTEALEALGHRAGARNLNSGLHAIEIEYTDSGRIFWGGVDPRREGAAIGD